MVRPGPPGGFIRIGGIDGSSAAFFFFFLNIDTKQEEVLNRP